ncbi:MAG TPA: hypothetical protein PLN53_06130 [Terricaulis sp.]|nr:hypothetical protein [Terricaulis sp.]
MSGDAPIEAHRTHKRLGKIEEGVTFVLFVVTLASQSPVLMAVAAIWVVLTLALPLFWRGAFTFALARSRAPDEPLEPDPSEPKSIGSLMMMALALGIVSCFALWGASLPIVIVVVSVAAALGSALFAAIYVVDPPIRTAAQMALLAFECLLWGIGACVVVLRLLAP